MSSIVPIKRNYSNKTSRDFFKVNNNKINEEIKSVIS